MYFEFLGEISYALIIYIISKGSSESDSIQPSPSRRKEVFFFFVPRCIDCLKWFLFLLPTFFNFKDAQAENYQLL